MKKTVKVFSLFLIGITLSSCSLKTQQSDNFAHYRYGTVTSDRAMNDGDSTTVAAIPSERGERIFILTFEQQRPVHKIVIRNANLFKFDLDYWDEETESWTTARQIRQKQNVGSSLAQPDYVMSRLDFETTKIRINVLETVDDKVITQGIHKRIDADTEKIIGHRRWTDRGHLIEMNRVMQLADAKIREIEIYNLQPPEAFTQIPQDGL